jgi:hypothetical protein
MKPVSMLDQGMYSLEWIKDFYTQAGIWWGQTRKTRKRPVCIPPGSKHWSASVAVNPKGS